MAEGSEREPLLGEMKMKPLEIEEDILEVEDNGIPDIPDLVSSSPANTNTTRIQPQVYGETTPITSFVMIILFVFVVLVSPATILELTQDIRETEDQNVSNYMKFVLTALTIFVITTVQISSYTCSRGNGVTETSALPICIPKWKVIPYMLIGIPAIISFVAMCIFAADNASEFCMNLSRLIFVFVQYFLLLSFRILIPVRCNCYMPRSVFLRYFQIAFAIASNVAICIDLIIEENREIPQDFLAYVYPFRFEFLLFSISMWLEFLKRNESEVESDSIELDLSRESPNQNTYTCKTFNFILAHVVVAFCIIINLYNWLSSCSKFKNTPQNDYNHSNTTNATSDNIIDKSIFPQLNIILYLTIIVYEIVLLFMIECKTRTTSAMHRSLKPKEVLLIICALSFNVYQMAIIIPDIHFLVNQSHDHWLYTFTLKEVIESVISIIYIFIQTALILKLARLEHRVVFKTFPLISYYYSIIAVNMAIWLLSCFEKLNECVAWEFSKAYKHYWHILQNSLFPVGIFFQWHSGELLFDIGLELKLSVIYITMWCLVCQFFRKFIEKCRYNRRDAMTVT